MSILHLVLVCTILLLFEVILLKMEYTSPAVIFTASFAVCSICTTFLGELWDIQMIQEETFFLIISSIILFVVIDQITRWACILLTGSKIKLRIKEDVKQKPIFVSKTVLYMALMISVVCLFWTCGYILRFAGRGSLNAVMAAYKNVVNTDVASFGLSRKLLNQFMKIATASTYLCLFIFIHNSGCTNIAKKDKVLYYLTFAAFVLFRMLLSGGRQGALFFVVAWITMYYICNTHKMSTVKVKSQRKKYVAYLIVAICIIFPLFYYSGRMVGRKQTDVLYAATAYLSTGIYGLEQEIKNHYHSSYWGEISFPGLYPILKFLGVIPKYLEEQSFLPFFWHGNTVSLLGRWYWDFGVMGVYIMLSLVAFAFCWLYYAKIKYAKNGSKRNFAIIVYGYCVHVLYFAGYDDFFMNFPSLNFTLTMLLLYIFYVAIVQYRVKFTYGRRRIR